MSRKEVDERWEFEKNIGPDRRSTTDSIDYTFNMPAGLDPMTVGDTPCICMEYCDGGDLRQVGMPLL